MSGDLVIRSAVPEDAAAILEIYAPVVRDSPTSFEYEPPTVEEMRARIESSLRTHAWLVAEDANGLLGYAYGSTHRSRAGYQWSAEVSVYIAPMAQRRGVGRRLYEALFARLLELGYRRAFAGITLPNQGSVALHEAVGFTPIGVFHRIGYKSGAWHDVGWWERSLGDDDTPPVLTRRS